MRWGRCAHRMWQAELEFKRFLCLCRYSAAPSYPPMPDQTVEGARPVNRAVEKNRGLTPHRHVAFLGRVAMHCSNLICFPCCRGRCHVMTGKGPCQYWSLFQELLTLVLFPDT